MKRVIASFASTVLLASVVSVPLLRADVKTSQKVTFKLAGVLGMIVNRMAGGADGITSTISLKGPRKFRATASTGEIVDLGEQKVYSLDMKKKEYTVKTFDELRADFEKARADAAKSAANEKPSEKPAAPAQNEKQYEYEVAVKKTGQHKTLLGHDTTEVVVTLTGHEKGKKLEDAGGFVMTNDLWMAPKIASLDDIRKFDMKYFEAIYGQDLTLDMKQAAQVMAAVPAFATFTKQMQAEADKNPELQGTALMTTMTFDNVKSAAEMKDQSSSSSSSSGGSGLGGILGKKLLGGRGEQSNGPRSTVLTTSTEFLSIEPAVTDADVALPAGFKLKK